MNEQQQNEQQQNEIESALESGELHTPPPKAPRWAFFIAILLVGGMLSILSENLTLGPSWTILFLAIVLLIPMLVAIFRGHHHWTRIFALSAISVVTIGLLSSVLFLIYALFTHAASASSLFLDAGLLWIINIIVFASWYWEIDRGGPLKRHSRLPEPADFLFPQMTLEAPHHKRWIPTFIDYVFLAFNTNTAFSPTDTMVLSKRAKVLMTLQSSISLLIVVVLAARAVNIA